MGKKKLENNAVTTLSVDALRKQAGATLEHLGNKVVTVSRSGKIFIRQVKSRGKSYQQVCRHYYDSEGKRKIEIARLTWPSEK